MEHTRLEVASPLKVNYQMNLGSAAPLCELRLQNSPQTV